MYGPHYTILAERATPAAVHVAIRHAAKAKALNHEEFNEKWRRLGAFFTGTLLRREPLLTQTPLYNTGYS